MTRLADLIPDFIKPVLRPLYSLGRSSRLFTKIALALYPESRNAVYQYWRETWSSSNPPQARLEEKEQRSQFLVKIVERYATPSAKILEIGCDVGRSLNYLFLAGFENLAGIEISEEAVQFLKQSYPEMARNTKFYNMPVEEIIKRIKEHEFDIVFTMATFGHIHTDSDWIFPEVVRITKDILITIEEEHTRYWWHFPRNYREVFEPLGMRQIEGINCSEVEGLSRFITRVFKKI